LRFSLSYRDVEELRAERGISVDHVTLWRWVQRYAPELEKRLRKRLKATNDSWRVDETYVRVKGQWRYLYRAVDSCGATLDLLLSATQDGEAAKRFLANALGRQNHPEPRVIHTDGHGAYPPAIVQLKTVGLLDEHCRHRVGRYLNNRGRTGPSGHQAADQSQPAFPVLLGRLAHVGRLRPQHRRGSCAGCNLARCPRVRRLEHCR
jgi:IS6 family transposase